MNIFDDVLDEEARARIYQFLSTPGWECGWKSNPKLDTFSFWHKHFAGWRKHTEENTALEQTDNLILPPDLAEFWDALQTNLLPDYRLIRCYANALPYGCDGTLHTDSCKEGQKTVIYYPHEKWDPNWGGETVFFNEDKTDIIASVYPKPNRLLIFDGRTYHIARGVSRTCPLPRITLMFKVALPSS